MNCLALFLFSRKHFLIEKLVILANNRSRRSFGEEGGIVEQSKSKEKFKRKDWYKLDLSAIVYPTLQRKDFSSGYRLSVLMKEEVDPKLLQ